MEIIRIGFSWIREWTLSQKRWKGHFTHLTNRRCKSGNQKIWKSVLQIIITGYSFLKWAPSLTRSISSTCSSLMAKSQKSKSKGHIFQKPMRPNSQSQKWSIAHLREITLHSLLIPLSKVKMVTGQSRWNSKNKIIWKNLISFSMRLWEIWGRVGYMRPYTLLIHLMFPKIMWNIYMCISLF